MVSGERYHTPPRLDFDSERPSPHLSYSDYFTQSKFIFMSYQIIMKNVS